LRLRQSTASVNGAWRGRMLARSRRDCRNFLMKTEAPSKRAELGMSFRSSGSARTAAAGRAKSSTEGRGRPRFPQSKAGSGSYKRDGRDGRDAQRKMGPKRHVCKACGEAVDWMQPFPIGSNYYYGRRRLQKNRGCPNPRQSPLAPEDNAPLPRWEPVRSLSESRSRSMLINVNHPCRG
jgi:hypothetical protein